MGRCPLDFSYESWEIGIVVEAFGRGGWSVWWSCFETNNEHVWESKVSAHEGGGDF